MRALLLVVALLVLAACGGTERPHLLLLTVDTLRADHVGAFGGARGLTPGLDRLAGESLVFHSAYAPAPFTLASVAALLCGRYPRALGIENNSGVLPADVPLLAEELGRAGYRTGAVVSNWVLRRGAGLERGFERYDDRMERLEAKRPVPERAARATTDAALVLTEELAVDPARPLFLWVHYQDPHGPYTPPAGYAERYLSLERAAPGGRQRLPVSPHERVLGAIPSYQALDGVTEVAEYRSRYDGEIRYLDDELVRLREGLRERLGSRPTVLVFAADHGESLGESSYWFAHGEFLSEALVRVPLLVSVPGAGVGPRADVASLLDLFPTLLALAGVVPSRPHEGGDLLAPQAAERPSRVYLDNRVRARPRYGLVEGSYKYLLDLAQGEPRGTLLRVGSPATEEPVQNAAVASRMRGTLRDLRDRLVPPPERRERAPSEEDRQRLRALGYLD